MIFFNVNFYYSICRWFLYFMDEVCFIYIVCKIGKYKVDIKVVVFLFDNVNNLVL